MKQNPPNQFHALTVKYTGRTNRIVTEIGVFPAFDPETKPPSSQYRTTALWDTGATGSVITGATAKAMNLIAIGTTYVNHAGGSDECNVYLVNIVLPNNVMVAGVKVIEGNQILDQFGAIIGMDIIGMGDFSITNVNNITWMSFRIPSITAIDYVVEANRVTYSGTSRNAPCPCGSGKKFKDCHSRLIR